MQLFAAQLLGAHQSAQPRRTSQGTPTGVLVALLLGCAVLLAACGDDDDSSDPAGPADAAVDSGPPADLGQPDTGCHWHPVPRCPNGEFAEEDELEPGCEYPTYHCSPCPDPTDFPPCPPGQTHQPEANGCLSGVLCDCSITQPPGCPEGEVPQYYGEVDGKRCLTGACGPDCPPVDPPVCDLYEEQERDERGCLTGQCVPIPCPPVEPPVCACGQRPGRSPAGCITGACTAEPDACSVHEIPDCPEGRVPELGQGSSCLTGRCVVGVCINRCERDSDCASSDVCLSYEPACNACFPKPCLDFRDCPFNSDCVAGHCQLRDQPTCAMDDDCDPDLVCDSAQCGACEPPCDCVSNADCARGTRCIDCECVQGCRDDADCELPQRCHVDSGTCMDCVCAEHEECPLGEYCNGCFCRVGCRVDDECPPWHFCSPATHACEPADQCQRSSQCERGERCVDGRCMADPGACEEDPRTVCKPFFDDCSCDYLCLLEGQEPQSCERDCGDLQFVPAPMCSCGAEQSCAYTGCNGPDHGRCPGPYHCSSPDPFDVRRPGICREGRPPARQLCREDADCVPEDCCRPTVCVRADMADCRSEPDCDDEQCRPEIRGCSCVEGVCVTDYDRASCP